MRPEQWKRFKETAKNGPAGDVPLALLVDSPWIPGFLGVNHLDYYLDPEVWFHSNLRIAQEFPDIIFVPSWWPEFGMATEPSAFGCKVCFRPDRPPDVAPCLKSIGDAEGLTAPDPASDGLMPLVLRQWSTRRERILDSGYTIPFAPARGPLCLASFLRGVTGLMLDLVERPEETHRLLNVVTETVIRWLKAQCEAIGETVEGIFLLDDVPGLLSRRLYLEFAHPYLKRVFDAFPKEWVKVYHNDANVRPFAADLAGLGIDVLNWSHRYPVADAFVATGGKLCLMGNVAPLELAVNGSPGDVRSAALEVLKQAQGKPLILSVGGGSSPGMPRANVQALVDALNEWNGAQLRP